MLFSTALESPQESERLHMVTTQLELSTARVHCSWVKPDQSSLPYNSN